MKIQVTMAAQLLLIIVGGALLIALSSPSWLDAQPAPDWASKAPYSLSITLSTDKSQYKLGEEILVTIQAKNISSKTVLINVFDNVVDYDLVIGNGKSEMQPVPVGQRRWHSFTAPIRPSGLSPNATIIDPGTRGNFSPIGDWGLKIDKPGIYSLTAVSRQTQPSQRSNSVQITVTK